MNLAAFGGAAGLKGDVAFGKGVFCGQIGTAMDASTAVLGFVGDPLAGDMVFQHGDNFLVGMTAGAGEGTNAVGLARGSGGYFAFVIFVVNDGQSHFFFIAADGAEVNLAALGGAAGLKGDVALGEAVFCGQIGTAMNASTAVLGFIGDPLAGDMVFQHRDGFLIGMAAGAGEGANAIRLTSGSGGYLALVIFVVGKDRFFAFAAHTAVTAFCGGPFCYGVVMGQRFLLLCGNCGHRGRQNGSDGGQQGKDTGRFIHTHSSRNSSIV